MGISGLSQFIPRRFPKAISTIDHAAAVNPRSYKNVLVELNPILHEHMRKREFLLPHEHTWRKKSYESIEIDDDGTLIPVQRALSRQKDASQIEAFMQLQNRVEPPKVDLIKLQQFVFSDLNDTLARFQPARSLFMVQDGVAPISKMKSQKQKRAKLFRQNFMKLHISPGTQFMHEIELMTNDFIRQQNLGSIEFTFSGSAVSGEGELKLWQQIHALEKEQNLLGYACYDKKYLISCSDFDTIVMACLSDGQVLEKLDVHLRTNTNSRILLNGSALVEAFAVIDQSSPYSVAKDFAFLVSLLGGEFLPHFQGGVTIEKLFAAYTRLRQPGQFVYKPRTGVDGAQFFDLDMKLLIACLCECNKSKEQNALKDLGWMTSLVTESFRSSLWMTHMWTKSDVYTTDYNYRPHPFRDGPYASQVKRVHDELGHDEFLALIQPQLKPSAPIDTETFSLVILPDSAKCMVRKELQHLVGTVNVEDSKDLYAELLALQSVVRQLSQSKEMRYHPQWLGYSHLVRCWP